MKHCTKETQTQRQHNLRSHLRISFFSNGNIPIFSVSYICIWPKVRHQNMKRKTDRKCFVREAALKKIQRFVNQICIKCFGHPKYYYEIMFSVIDWRLLNPAIVCTRRVFVHVNRFHVLFIPSLLIYLQNLPAPLL